MAFPYVTPKQLDKAVEDLEKQISEGGGGQPSKPVIHELVEAEVKINGFTNQGVYLDETFEEMFKTFRTLITYEDAREEPSVEITCNFLSILDVAAYALIYNGQYIVDGAGTNADIPLSVIVGYHSHYSLVIIDLTDNSVVDDVWQFVLDGGDTSTLRFFLYGDDE